MIIMAQDNLGFINRDDIASVFVEYRDRPVLVATMKQGDKRILGLYDKEEDAIHTVELLFDAMVRKDRYFVIMREGCRAESRE